MVSFRFHLVSLVAVFLALGLGVLIGTTVINRGIVAGLEAQTDTLSGDLAEVRDQVARLQSDRDVWSAFGQEAMDPILSGRLNGSRVVVIAEDGTDDATIDGVLAALRAATADPQRDVVGPVFVTSRMALERDEDREALGAIVGTLTLDDPNALLAEASEELADRLADGAIPGRDVLEALLAEGFLVGGGQRLDEATVGGIGGPGQVVVVMAGGPASSGMQPERFLVPLVGELARDGAAVAAAEPANGEDDEPPFVALLRSDGALSAQIATQDNVDQLTGQIGLVVALGDLLRGVSGHYGVKEGASSPIPDIVPVPAVSPSPEP